MPCSVCGLSGHNIRSCRRINPDFYPNPNPNSMQPGPFVGRENVQEIINRRPAPDLALAPRPAPAPAPAPQQVWRNVTFKNEYDCDMIVYWIGRGLKLHKKEVIGAHQIIISNGWVNGTKNCYI